ncbi:MAG: beta-lactamase family protein [Actinobacteria bacterium]|nr:beta-lactamase family protein [Actinomycetota bacterium]
MPELMGRNNKSFSCVMRVASGCILAAFLLLSLMALVVVVPGCGEKAQKPAAFDGETTAQLEQAVREAMERDGIPGVVAGAWVPGRGEWMAAAGLADRDTGEEIEATDLMRIGSVTKSFTGTLVLELVDEGLVGLDDPLAEYFPWVENAQDITVRMLLGHTSGIVDDYENPAFLDIASADPLYRWDPEELVRASLGTYPEAVLGETCVYSNTNYVLLGMIVEQVTGMELAGAMEKYVFEPLGLDSTVFPPGPEIEGEHSRSYVVAEGELYDMTSGIDPSITWAAGAIVSALEDVKVWAEALATGELLEEATHEEQLRWIEMMGAEEAGIGYEYGLGILKLGDFVGHNGEFSGFLASMFYLPSQQATIVVLLNCNANPVAAQDLFMRIAAILFPHEVPDGW